MTVLPSETTRNALNIDRFDKAFVWSALALRQTLQSNPNLADFVPYIKVGHSLYKAGKFQLILEVKLRYQSQVFLTEGGDLTNAIIEFSSDNPLIPGLGFLASESKDVLTIPGWVNSLEEYCYWAAVSVLRKDGYEKKSLNIVVNEEQYPDAYVLISAKLDADEKTFFEGYSYVDSLSKAATVQPPPVVIDPGSVLNNTVSIDNTFLVKN